MDGSRQHFLDMAKFPRRKLKLVALGGVGFGRGA